MVQVRCEPPLTSVVIPAFNSAHLLAQTLDAIATRARLPQAWELIVVDNNSTDQTRAVVEERTASFPVPLRYVFEGAQGRSHALNAGIRASTAPVLVFTDADVVVDESWLPAAVEPLFERTVDYTGGPVRPIWGANGRIGWHSTEAICGAPLRFSTTVRSPLSLRNVAACHWAPIWLSDEPSWIASVYSIHGSADPARSSSARKYRSFSPERERLARAVGTCRRWP